MMARYRLIFLSFSVIGVLSFAGLLRAGLDNQEREDLFRSLGILAEVVHLVENEYVDELNDEALALSLDAGLVESVDRWAALIPADKIDRYKGLLESPPAFGLMLGGRMGSAAVRFAIPGSPAAEAGLEAWEVIEKVNGIYTRGRPLWLIRLELQEFEEKEQAVSLTLMDRDVDERREVVLEPGAWVTQAVEVEDRDEIRLVTVSNLTPGAAGAVEEALRDAQKVVLDLRELVWGVEAEAIAVADLFLAEGEIGGWKGRRAGEEAFPASVETATDVEPVVLVGYNTEGVGEILAEALRRGGSPMVGWTTAGHAPHMRFVDGAGLNLYIPVGQWLDADGEPINGAGIEPDHEIEPADEDSDEDPALDRALEIAAGENMAEPAELEEAA